MGPAILKFGMAYARLAWPSILVGQVRKPNFNNATPLLVKDNLSIEKTWVTLC
jgi:hypothetical protein